MDRVEDALGMAIDHSVRRPSLILAEFALPYGGAVRQAAMARGIPYAVHLRGDDVWVWPHRDAAHLATFREVVQDAALVAGVSAAITHEALRLAEVPDRRAVVVRNGVDLARFAARSASDRAHLRTEFGIADDEIAVLCVASELEAKGWKDLLDAIAGLVADAPRLCLYCAVSGAHGDMIVESEASIRAPGLRLRVFRELSHDRLADLYASVDVFALASHSEGLSNALLEAMASSLCVVTTDVGGHAEVIDHGTNGLLTPARDVVALRSALQQVRTSDGLRRAFGSAARSRMEQVGDPQRAGAELAAELDRVKV